MKPPRHARLRRHLPRVATLIAFGFISSCGKPSPTTGEQQPTEPKSILPQLLQSKTALPVDRTLTDKIGRTLEATIVAHSGNSIHIIRKADGVKAEIILSTLSEKDRNFVSGLELKDVPPTFIQSGTANTPDADMAYIKSREDEIRKLEEENKRLSAEAETSSNQMLARSRMTTIRKNEAEIAKLKTAIKIYRQEKGL